MLAFAACSSEDEGAPPAGPVTTDDASTNPGAEGGGGSSSGGSSSGGTDAGADAGPNLANLQKLKAQMLTSFWENDTTVFQYAFARNNNDGFGYTAGRIGFTTATGDGYEIVTCFDSAFTGAGNLRKKYEPPLKVLYDKLAMTGQIQPNVSTLDAVGNYPADWTATANNATTAPAFHGCQDQRVDLRYWAPTLPIMQKWGITTALSRAALYDATVVHGEDNVNNLAKQANNDTGNTAQTPAAAPLSETAESNWLKAFLIHRAALVNSSVAWKAAIARCANYEQWRRDGNFDFSKKLVTNATADVMFPGNGYTSNGYQACVINPDGSVSGVPQCTAPVSN